MEGVAVPDDVGVGEVGVEDRVGEGAGRRVGRSGVRRGAAAAAGQDSGKQQRRGGQAAAALRGAQDYPLSPLRDTPSMTKRWVIANRISTGMLAITPPAMIVE